MKKLLFVILLVIAFTSIRAQFVSYQDGSPAREIRLENVEGSELLFTEWKKGKVVLANGSIYNQVSIKYNVYEDQLYFLGKDNQTMKFVSPVTSFELDGARFKNGFAPIKKFTPSSYYQILVEGNATLLKKITKDVVENKEFNSATLVKKIVDQKNYFIYHNGSINILKGDKSSFIELFQDKKTELEAYFKSNKVSFKKDDDLIAVIAYYNKLQ